MNNNLLMLIGLTKEDCIYFLSWYLATGTKVGLKLRSHCERAYPNPRPVDTEMGHERSI